MTEIQFPELPKTNWLLDLMLYLQELVLMDKPDAPITSRAIKEFYNIPYKTQIPFIYFSLRQAEKLEIIKQKDRKIRKCYHYRLTKKGIEVLSP